jgi:hypothetical protein
MSLERKSLKEHVYTESEIKSWLKDKKRVEAEITSGETGEAFAVYFYPTSREEDFKKLIRDVMPL